MKKYLIINADDFGLSTGVNRAIGELHQAGVVSSTTVMVNMPGFKEAIALARQCPALGVGLHFNLGYGTPICPSRQVASLVNQNGYFSQQADNWKENEVELELEAQWRRLVDAGIRPTHIDSHQFVQCYYPVFRPLVKLCQREKLPLRRVPGEPLLNLRRPPAADYSLLDTYFDGNGKERLHKNLESLRPGVTELMCHPAYVDDTLISISSWTLVREEELRVFADSDLLPLIKQLDINLIHYGQIKFFR